MFVFVVGMERCGTHSAANIIRSAAAVSSHVEHEEEPTWCREAKLIYEEKDFRTTDFKKKIANLRLHAKTHKLVCEANHRLSFFSTLLMREFAPDCKFVFLIRDPIATITSRIATWAHFKDYIDKYPADYVKEIERMVLPGKRQFNEFRLAPPKQYAERELGELYAWEWVETYKYARRELHNIPVGNRKIMRCEDLTSKFRDLLDFIGSDYFNVDDEVVGWSRTKSDSVYYQDRFVKTDRSLTQNRDPGKDGPLIFARQVIDKSGIDIKAKIISELGGLPKIDRDLIDMDMAVVDGYLKKDQPTTLEARIFI